MSPDAKAHPYPFQIGLQTQEFIQSSLFLGILTDIASGQHVREPHGIASIERELLNNGLDEAKREQGWELIKKFKVVHSSWLFQSVLVMIMSQWDWYIRNLGRFVEFALQGEAATIGSSTGDPRLRKIGFKGIIEQLDILQEVIGNTFSINDHEKSTLLELALVRNLGLHNRWEVDEYYLGKSAVRSFGLGHLRLFDEAELTEWHGTVLKAVGATTTPVAVRFVHAAAYTGQRGWHG